MDGRIVETVASHLISCMEGKRCSEARVVIAYVFRLSVELIHITDIGDFPDISDSAVSALIKSGIGGRIDYGRRAYPIEVVNYQDLLDCGSYAGAREKGLVRMEGKDYVVQDGDVILFRFNV